MPNNLKSKPYTLYALHIPILIAVFAAVIGGSFLAADKVINPESPAVQGKKTEKVTGKPVDAKNASSSHKQAVDKAVKTIKDVSDKEKSVGNKEASTKLDSVVFVEERVVEDTVAALEEAGSQPGWKTLLVGPDYKNLGELRSSLAHNTNTIRQLTHASTMVKNQGSTEAIQTQLQTMLQERERIMNVIRVNEGQFSFLGWVNRIIFGYTDQPLETEEDQEVIEEAEDIISGDDSSPTDDQVVIGDEPEESEEEETTEEDTELPVDDEPVLTD